MDISPSAPDGGDPVMTIGEVVVTFGPVKLDRWQRFAVAEPDDDVLEPPAASIICATRTAVAIKLLAPHANVIGVEPELENDAWQSFHNSVRVHLRAASASVADAIKVQTLGELTYPMIRRYVDNIVTVPWAPAARFLFSHPKLPTRDVAKYLQQRPGCAYLSAGSPGPPRDRGSEGVRALWSRPSPGR